MERGYTTLEKTVWCGGCNRWHQSSASQFKITILKLGWRLTRKSGWLCSDCYARKKTSKS